MSVYDFDNQPNGDDHNATLEQSHHSSVFLAATNQRDDSVVIGTSNSSSGTYVSNGVHPLTRYNQAESNFLNRTVSTSVNQSSDISVSMTRPTSKTALLVRQRRAMLEQLSCFLCKGYLIDATTIDECMDSFCKSCIVVYLRSQNNCPKCGVLIHKTNPLSSIRSDKVLQDIVYKLVPGLYDDEMKRRRDFYRGLFGTTSSSSSDDDGSSSSEDLPDPSLRSEKYGTVSHPKPFYKPSDCIDISIEPQLRNDCNTIYYDNKRQSIITCFTGNLNQRQVSSSFSTVESHHFKTYLRCPAKLTVSQLKKFIAAKFNVCREDTMHLLYLNESLRDEYSLIDVAYIYDWRGIEHMRMFYIIERDLSKMELDLTNMHQPNEHSSLTGKTTRQTTGTSTQAVKRVCIDPQPTFYEEERNNNTIVTNSSGRSMRPRTTEQVSNNKTTVAQNPQAPILRSYHGTATKSSEASISSDSTRSRSGSHEISNRELVALNTGHNSRQQPAAYRSHVQVAAANELSRLRNDSRSSRRQTSSNSDQVTTKSILKSNSGAERSCRETNGQNDVRPASLADSRNREKNLIVGTIQQPQQTYRYQQQQYQPHNQQLQYQHQQSQQVQPQQQNHTQQTSNVQQNHQIQQAQQTSVRRLIPFVGSGYASTTTCVAGPSKSSLVTLASFTEAHSNHVVATLSSTSATAATISNSYRNMLGSQSLVRDPMGGTTWTTGQAASTMAPSQPSLTSSTATTTSKNSTQSAPQLAFSFVTERGITIVRRLNNQTDNQSANNIATSPTTTTMATQQRLNSVPALPAPPSNNNQSRQQQQNQSTSANNSSRRTSSPVHVHHQNNHSSGVNQTNSSLGSLMRAEAYGNSLTHQSSTTSSIHTGSTGSHQSSNNEYNRARHHIKVKPVYKTLVDPTKVKSPNFKKNHTARH